MSKRSSVISNGKVYEGEVVHDSPPDIVSGLASLLFIGPAFPGAGLRGFEANRTHHQTIKTDDGKTVSGRKK